MGTSGIWHENTCVHNVSVTYSMHNLWLLYFGLFSTLEQLGTGNKPTFLSFVWEITGGVTCMYSTSIWGCSCGRANAAGLVWANIYLHVEGMFHTPHTPPQTLNNGEIRMACDDGIKPHNFRLGVDTVLLSTCVAEENFSGHYWPDGCSCFLTFPPFCIWAVYFCSLAVRHHMN